MPRFIFAEVIPGYTYLEAYAIFKNDDGEQQRIGIDPALDETGNPTWPPIESSLEKNDEIVWQYENMYLSSIEFEGEGGERERLWYTF